VSTIEGFQCVNHRGDLVEWFQVSTVEGFRDSVLCGAQYNDRPRPHIAMNGPMNGSCIASQLVAWPRGISYMLSEYRWVSSGGVSLHICLMDQKLNSLANYRFLAIAHHIIIMTHCSGVDLYLLNSCRDN
jgi:hypothetical protein